MSENVESGANAGPAVPLFRFIDGPNNRKILIKDNRRHSLHHKSKDGSQMWRCTYSKECKAKLKILGEQILHADRHLCTQNQHKTVSQTFKEECIEKVKNVHTPITEIYKTTVKEYVDRGYHLLEDIPSFKSVKSTIYRSRNMPPRQDIVAQPQVIRVEQVRPPPPPPPGRFQRPPHDHPMPYVRPPRATNVVNTR